MKKLLLLKPNIWLTAGLVSTALIYIYMLADQLSLKHDCFPEDGMCSSGNTVAGDIYWSLILTLFIAFPLWIIGLALFYIIGSVGSKKK